jgi:hypothetical protein
MGGTGIHLHQKCFHLGEKFLSHETAFSIFCLVNALLKDFLIMATAMEMVTVFLALRASSY